MCSPTYTRHVMLLCCRHVKNTQITPYLETVYRNHAGHLQPPSKDLATVAQENFTQSTDVLVEDQQHCIQDLEQFPRSKNSNKPNSIIERELVLRIRHHMSKLDYIIDRPRYQFLPQSRIMLHLQSSGTKVDECTCPVSTQPVHGKNACARYPRYPCMGRMDVPGIHATRAWEECTCPVSTQPVHGKNGRPVSTQPVHGKNAWEVPCPVSTRYPRNPCMGRMHVPGIHATRAWEEWTCPVSTQPVHGKNARARYPRNPCMGRKLDGKIQISQFVTFWGLPV